MPRSHVMQIRQPATVLGQRLCGSKDAMHSGAAVGGVRDAAVWARFLSQTAARDFLEGIGPYGWRPCAAEGCVGAVVTLDHSPDTMFVWTCALSCEDRVLRALGPDTALVVRAVPRRTAVDADRACPQRMRPRWTPGRYRRRDRLLGVAPTGVTPSAHGCVCVCMLHRPQDVSRTLVLLRCDLSVCLSVCRWVGGVYRFGCGCLS